MNVNHLYFLFEENMMKSLNLQTHIQWNSVRTNPAYNERSDITNRIESPV
jgi:hypothetical protein